MSDHTYQPGDRVERISTGETFIFEAECDGFVHVFSKTLNAHGILPASDCSPAVDHAAELAAKDAEIAKLRKLCGEAAEHIGCGGDACCKCNEHTRCQCSFFRVVALKEYDKLRAAAEGGE